jgi:hypothetical protein
MAIEITSLFRDILESPEQKQQRQMAEGFARSQNAVSQLTGLATAAAPLVGTMAELQGRRTEALQRGVGGLLGRDVRSTSEKLQDALKGFNPLDPQSVSQTTQMLQSIGLGAQGAEIAAMALEEQQKSKAMTEETALRAQQATSNNLAIESSQQQIAAETLRAEREQESYDQAKTIITNSSNMLRRVNPALANTFEGLFPATPEGATMARSATLAAMQAPERDLITETVINPESGLPEVTLFDKNDPAYRQALGVDDSSLSANEGKPFGPMRAASGQAIPQDAFNAKAQVQSIFSLAFNPNLEAVVGPNDVRRALFTFNLAPEAAAIRNQIERSQVAGILPIVRLIAPVTEPDVVLLKETQLGPKDSQETWIKTTIEEIVPNAINVMSRNLAEEGQSLSAVHQLAFASSERVLQEVVNNPGIFGDYSLNDAVNGAFAILPNINNVDVKELPTSLTIFKTPSGTLFSGEIVNLLRQRQNLTNEQVIDQFDLEVLER